MANDKFAKDEVKVQDNVAPAVDKEAAFKEAKKAAAKRFAEKKAAEKIANKENANKLIDVLKKNGAYDKLDEDLKAFLGKLANPSTGNGASLTTGLFRDLFGDNPQPGAKITLKDAIMKTLKGKAAIDAKVKVWAEKGTVVKVVPGATPLESVYELVSIGR